MKVSIRYKLDDDNKVVIIKIKGLDRLADSKEFLVKWKTDLRNEYYYKIMDSESIETVGTLIDYIIEHLETSDFDKEKIIRVKVL